MHADGVVAGATIDADRLLEGGAIDAERIVSGTAVEPGAARYFYITAKNNRIVPGTRLNRDIPWCRVSIGSDHEKCSRSVNRRVAQTSQDHLVIDHGDFDRIIDGIARDRQMRTAQTGQHVASKQGPVFQQLNTLRCRGRGVLRSIFGTTVSPIPHVPALFLSVQTSPENHGARYRRW